MNERLRQTISKIIGIPADSIDETTSAFDVEAWDSLKHVKLVLALEEEFSVRFEESELPILTEIPVIQESLARHGADLEA